METRIHEPLFDLAQLHALCLGSAGGGGGRAMAPAMALALAASFGSVARWRDDFVACAAAAGGGSGWALLQFQPRGGSLRNCWVADPAQAAAGAWPILAIELHGRAGLEALVDDIDWPAVHARYQHAVHAASETLDAGHGQTGGALLLDVRRAEVFAQARTMIRGARWHDPAAVADWSAALPADHEWVVYCVHGHEVSRAIALRLRAAGLEARFLEGGIEGWQAAGRPLVERFEGPAA